MYCIYRVKNNINGKTYIGQHYYGNNPDPLGYATRKGHYKGSGKILKLAYKKYGIKNFSIEVLYKRILTQETADSMESYAIKKEQKAMEHGEYNITLGGQFRKLCGEAYSNHIKECMKRSGAAEKISESMKGERNPRYGKPALNRGIPATDEAKEKNRLAHLGKKMSEGSRQKISDFMKAQPNSGTWKKGHVPHNKGKVYYKDPNSMKSKMFFEGQQPVGWIKGRWTPWQGK